MVSAVACNQKLNAKSSQNHTAERPSRPFVATVARTGADVLIMGCKNLPTLTPSCSAAVWQLGKLANKQTNLETNQKADKDN